MPAVQRHTRPPVPAALRPPLVAALTLLATLPTSGATAEVRELTLDPAASEIRFTLGATLHSVEGTVAVDRGTLRFDLETGEMSGEVVADAASAETGNEDRDQDMHRKVLESDSFGTFALEPERFEGELSLSGSSRVEVHGRLRIHGSSHPVVLPTEVEIDGDRLTAEARLTVPYVDWGMTDPSKFLLRVSKAVEVELRAVGTLTAPAAPDSPGPCGE